YGREEAARRDQHASVRWQGGWQQRSFAVDEVADHADAVLEHGEALVRRGVGQLETRRQVELVGGEHEAGSPLLQHAALPAADAFEYVGGGLAVEDADLGEVTAVAG